MSNKESKAILISKLSETLKPGNFKRKGNIFTRSNGDITYYISLQSSQSSTADILKVTMNIEISSAVISELDDISIPLHDQRHYFRRIGTYMENMSDKWWTIDNVHSAEKTANEIIFVITQKVIPHLETITSTQDLEAIWNGDGYIGITDGQRKRYLSLLQKRSK
jgi:arabinogalactan endo-1,4-beta-galactosidase